MEHIIAKEEKVIYLEEEKQEEEDVVNNLQPQPSRQISTVSTKFDAGGKGYLTQTEQKARKLANKDGSIDPDAAIKLMKSHDKLILYLKIIAMVVFFLCVAVVAMGISLSKGINNTGQNTQASIVESVQTKVAVDPLGASRLLDKQTGNEITVRANGDSFVTTARFDALTGEKLDCLSIGDIALMVSDISKGIQGSVIFKDEDDLESEIISIAGNFQDKTSFLQFDSFRVILDSDSCETSVGTPIDMDPDTTVDIGPVSEAADTLEEKDESEEEKVPNEEESDLINRHLRHMPSRAIPVGRSQTHAHYRDEYIKARTALKEGRKLQRGTGNDGNKPSYFSGSRPVTR